MSDKTVDTRDRWLKRLKREEKAHADFRDAAKKATEMFFAESTRTTVSYPLFWSTVKVLHGRIFSQPPTPDVRKRWNDESAKQPVGPAGSGGAVSGQFNGLPAGTSGAPVPGGPGLPRGPALNGAPGATPPATPPAPVVDDNKIALSIERGITYTIDTTPFDSDGHAAVNDLLMAGLGVAKVEMTVETSDVPIINPATGQPILDTKGEPLSQTIVTDQSIMLRHFAWSQFRWEPQQHWSQVSWVAFMHYMTEDEIEDQFGITVDSADGDAEDYGNDAATSDTPDADKYKSLFKVYEVWHKPSRKVIFVTDAHMDVLEVRDDPLGLKDFFPCPKPMMVNVKGDDLIPKPDYAYCEKMFEYVNTLTNRIDALTRQIKDIGFYDSAFTGLDQLTTARDGDLFPISNLYAQISALNPAAAAGYDAIVFKQDNTGKVAVVQQLVELRDLAKQVIWEIYGVSDIQRGATNASETATAQSIKAQWADIRVGERIRIVALFFRDIFRIMGEILAEKVKPEILAKMTGIELSPPEIEILQSDVGRSYAIDIESDSTVVQDEFAEQQQRMAFLEAFTKYLHVVGPAMMQNQIPADLAKEVLLVCINSFKTGRQVEDAINNLPNNMQQLGALNQKLQQAGEQIKGLTQQAQGLQKQLQGVNQQKEQRENAKTVADVQQKGADTTQTEVETAKIAAETSGKIIENHLKTVLPFQPPQRGA